MCLRDGVIPYDWRTGLTVPMWKRKGSVQDLGMYTFIILVSHEMKVLERILDVRIRKCGDGDRRRTADV